MGRSFLTQPIGFLNRTVGKIFRPPCPHLCEEYHNQVRAMCPQHTPFKLHRFHFTCLTCPRRRYTFQGEKSGYKIYPYYVVKLESASGKGFILPKDYHSYGLLINVNTRFYTVKRCLLKILMTICERIAE